MRRREDLVNEEAKQWEKKWAMFPLPPPSFSILKTRIPPLPLLILLPSILPGTGEEKWEEGEDN
jgi:hypothetical protein